MPLLSVVVPVYLVAEYLPACLDSVLSQAGAQCEVIAVDDASPDACATILAEYAGRDPRLRVLTLARNGGLGAARNAGLGAATGRYVWFVDSDDWLPPGTVAAVVERLTRTAPDVLVVDYVRMFPDGSGRVYAAAELLPDGAAWPEVFTIAQRPELLRSLHLACTKVVRRAYLLEVGVRFAPGWYEDVSFSLPLLLAGRRLGVLGRVCYCYRQRATGAITQTVGERHFDVFAQWERVFAFLDRRGDLDALRALVFARMMWHLLAVFGNPQRVPVRRRRDFFREMTGLYRRHAPGAGYLVPPGPDGVKSRLVARGAYRTFAVGRLLGRPRRGAGSTTRSLVATLRRVIGRSPAPN